VIDWDLSGYCASAIVKNIYDKVIWRLVVVYGSPYEDTKIEFLRDLDQMLEKWQSLTIQEMDMRKELSAKLEQIWRIEETKEK
jgi:uncharacterized protein YfkK (UPF0435 family)